jgi:metallophosphoesterase (TIGR00282 family)
MSNTMRVLFIGDVVGETGCKAVSRYLPKIKKELSVDVAILNGENAAFHGMSQAIVDQFFKDGIDGITSGNHMWDCQEIYDFIETEERMIRPMNWVEKKPGRGSMVLEKNGKRILVVNCLGRLFMGDEVHNPFKAVDNAIKDYTLGKNIDGIILDFHTETSAEKQAMGAYLDGRISLVVGTHTHVPTADDQVLPNGTAYITDIGMTCDYDSNIGVRKDLMMESFLGIREKDVNFTCADGEPTFCAVLVDIDTNTGLAQSIEPVRIGGRLRNTHTQFNDI